MKTTNNLKDLNQTKCTSSFVCCRDCLWVLQCLLNKPYSALEFQPTVWRHEESPTTACYHGTQINSFILGPKQRRNFFFLK